MFTLYFTFIGVKAWDITHLSHGLFLYWGTSIVLLLNLFFISFIYGEFCGVNIF